MASRFARKAVRLSRFASIAAAAVGGGATALALSHMIDSNDRRSTVSDMLAASWPEQAQADSKDRAFGRFTIADAVEKAAPAVVNITCHGTTHFLGPFALGEEISSGSGFIIESTNNTASVVTNAHVVGFEDIAVGSKVEVTLNDGKTFQGRVSHIDAVTDLAIVSVRTKEKLPTVELGTSSQLRPGEWVVAIGSPLSLHNTITAGIVSNTSRHGRDLGMMSIEPNLHYIQTDAAINTGNSGGPLVDLDGRVVGIASMKAAETDGISFAIPIDFAKNVVKQLRDYGFVKRPFLGIRMLGLNKNMLESIRDRASDFLPDNIDSGVLVVQVLSGGPAHRAGLRDMDVIVEVNGKPVDTAESVLTQMGDDFEKGIDITVLRGKPSKRLQMHIVPGLIKPDARR